MSESARGKASSDSNQSGKEFTCDICGTTLADHSGLTRHKRLKHSGQLEHECPSCDRAFSSDRGLKLHHKRTHGESLIYETSECKECGETFEYRANLDEPHTCSVECRDKWQTGENASNWKGGKITLTCEICGETFRHHENKAHRRFCSCECVGEWKSQTQRGENNPVWAGGAIDYYGPNWKAQRRRVRKRDQYRCQVCGKDERVLSNRPSVHHIKPIRWFKNRFEAPEWYKRGNRLSNLIMLCEDHHNHVEGWMLSPDTRGDS